MYNSRILHNNVSDSSIVTLTASSTATSVYESFAVSNLKNNRKGDVHRSVGTSVQYVLSSPVAATIGVISFPKCNLTSNATIQVRMYSDEAGTTLIHDTTTMTGMVPAKADYASYVPNDSNGFAYGAGEYLTVWFNNITSVKHIKIDITDSTNPAGYIECSRLVVGPHHEFTYNPQAGATISIIDNSTQYRADNGNQVVDRGTVSKGINFDLAFVPIEETKYLMQIITANGISNPFFVSLFPDIEDKRLEADHSIFGCLTRSSAFKLTFYGQNATSFDIEEF